DASVYLIDLPADLKVRCVHPRFHISKLRLHMPNNDNLFPGREPANFYDFGQAEDLESEVEEILTHEWNGDEVLFLVRWSFGDSSWELWENVKNLALMDRYFKIEGVSHVEDLPRTRPPVRGLPA
ncbi:hypothetical protein PUNSTDRAFT_26806, partial [Punctularia strigosozonata HHB-11173 SS5]